MATRHADIVKVWVDSVRGTKPSMSPEIYRAVIEEAHKRHLRVAAHVYYLADAKSLVNDGVDVLAHSVRDKPIDQELISAMKRRGVWYIPTFTVDESFYIYAEHPGFHAARFLQGRSLRLRLLTMLTSDAYSQKVNQDPKTAQHKADFAMDEQNMKAVYDAGVRVGFGTDSGAMPPAFLDSPSTGNWRTWCRRGSHRCKPSCARPRTTLRCWGSRRPGERCGQASART